jgi:c-di-GMP-binding flagellar brake protein YcgR
MLKKFATDISHGLRTMVRGLDADWDFTDRRKTIRFSCRYKVEVTRGEQTKVAYVINYSMGGLRFSSTHKYKVGDTVSIKFPHPLEGVTVRSISCEILFVRKNPKTLEMVCGAKFKETKPRMAASWVAYLFREKGVDSKDLLEGRKLYRTHCKLDVVARSGEERAVGHLINMSTAGACIAINRPAEVDDLWGLDIRGLSNLPAIHIKVTVLSCEMEAEGLYRQRVRFNSMDENTKAQLMSYLQHLAKNFWTE